MAGGPMGQAIDEVKRLGGPDKADIERIARRFGVDATRIRQRFARSATFARSLDLNRSKEEDEDHAQRGRSPAPRRASGEKHRVQLRFLINGAVIKLLRREFYRGEIRMLTRRGWEQCVCGRDLVEHSVPVTSDTQCPSLLCECGASYESEES